jgi:hypothetical protein
MIQQRYEQLDSLLKYFGHKKAIVFIVLDLEDFESREMAIWLPLRYGGTIKKICKNGMTKNITSMHDYRSLYNAYAVITLFAGKKSHALPDSLK